MYYLILPKNGEDPYFFEEDRELSDLKELGEYAYVFKVRGSMEGNIVFYKLGEVDKWEYVHEG